ncbi:polyprenyl synthetase family protein [Gracilimonas mengyeensis]|uniref:Geranylgeranyl diphosphate synthase, type II n=1 Tax=Gracilimonas mengyeensis TaxID=1302730 RepID=A0A521ANY3_9BACT|nr:polyprenyl synthetase family protein [Gracilimonas mengyeensis]SMO36517.1 geranylgeranyl diphosphate synthase, type II [Gracilimonas mengyeensis]
MSKTNLHTQLLEKIETGLKALDLPGSPVSLYEPYRYALSVGGKRIRPILALVSCGLCKGKVDDALPAALALEILHNFTLVHDDIMDSAETRRGEPSVYKKWSEDVAILSGDVMFADAYKQLAFYGHSEEYSKEEFAAIHDVFTQSVITVCEGQALDMEFVDRDSVTRDEYLEMISGKTAALISGALEMGAIAAHASTEQREQLASLGVEMGLAFQIQDDLLDATANPEKFGKRPGGDIFEGKKTYLTIFALERANTSQQQLIRQVLDENEPTQERVDHVLDTMKELNVLDDVAAQVQKHYQKAGELLHSFADSEYKQELQNLLNFLQNRDH